MSSNSNSRLKRSLTSEESKRSPSKRQFRNENEKRRRDLFSQLISNLEEILEIPSSNATTTSNKMDKASILRETSLFLRQHQPSSSSGSSGLSSLQSSASATDRSNEPIDFTWKPPSSLVTLNEWTQILIESMNSFLLITKSDPYNGQIVFVSKNISSLLDYSQEEVLNRSLFEFVSARDQDLLRDYFLKEHQILERCSVGWRRATADEYEQCSIIGAFRSVKREKSAADQEEKYLMSIVQVETMDRTLLVQEEIPLEEFAFRLNLQGKLIHFDLKACEYLGYHPDELVGQTYLNYIHPDDLPVMIRAHQLWKDFGNGTTDPYRFLTKGQQWIFFQSQCQVQMNSWTGKPEYYLCKTNLLISSNNSIPKQISQTSIVGNPLISRRRSLPTNVSVVSREMPPLDSMNEKTLEMQRKPSPDQSQITSFLSQLSNEFYRRNIREKFVERRTQKQSEIRLREEEIGVIDDMITFIDNYQSKHSSIQQTNQFNEQPPSSISQSTEQNNVELHKTFLQGRFSSFFVSLSLSIRSGDECLEMNQLERSFFRSPLNATIDEYSPQSSPLISSRLFVSFDRQFVVPPSSSQPSHPSHPSTRSTTTRENHSIDVERRKDDSLLHSHSSTISSSPTDNPLSMSCPPTPYSIVSRPSPNSPFNVTLSPATNDEIQQILQPQPLLPVPSLTTTTTTTNPSQSSTRPSSFNRSLPHSLVS